MANKYDFAPGARLVNKDPEEVYNALEEIRQKHGYLTAENVLKEASKKRHVLHKEFEWDDAKAAHQHRLAQGRLIIRSVVTVRDHGAPTTRTYSVVVNDSKSIEEPKKVYRTTEEILADPVSRAELLKDAMCEATAFRKKYYGLQELSKIVQSIDDTLQSMSV